jgi:hypothetical protein
MVVTWTVEGVNWSYDIKASINSEPSEIATRGVESAIKSMESEEESIEFGALLRIFHDKMISEDEHLIIYAPTILANAGYYKDAEELDKAIQKEYT